MVTTCLDLFLQQLSRRSTHQWHLAVTPSPFQYRPVLYLPTGLDSYRVKLDRRPKKLVEPLYSQNHILAFVCSAYIGRVPTLDDCILAAIHPIQALTGAQ
ncbi:hypothetical protein CVT26_010059 [Gymnopilus dilepis]|uniref:Uncharacterized protein n=1 Tax=Gymnopilus dilepis TaxID=231916 RepID=A0A409VWK2_9AGAR|nr:hypothetical protein CVT26_010059 [Gymnopilus dilepis]